MISIEIHFKSYKIPQAIPLKPHEFTKASKARLCDDVATHLIKAAATRTAAGLSVTWGSYRWGGNHLASDGDKDGDTLDWRENLETLLFPMKIEGFPVKFPLNQSSEINIEPFLGPKMSSRYW